MPNKSESDVLHIIQHVYPEGPFEDIPGRCHRHFPEFVLFTGVKSPEKFKARVLKHKKIYIEDMEIPVNLEPC